MRRHRRFRVAAALLVLASSAPAYATTPPPTPVPHDIGWSSYTPAIGGQSGYHNGQFVYQDWINDDAGARTNAIAGGGRTRQYGVLSSPRGSFRYPTNRARYAANAADIRVLRIALDDEHLHIRADMNSMLVADAAVLAFVLGSPDDTARHAWPHAAGIATPGQSVVTAFGADGTVTSLPDGTPVPIRQAGGSVSVDPAANALELSLPRSLMPPGDVVRVRAAAGLWDPAAGTWMAVGSQRSFDRPGGGGEGVPRLWNVAFRQEPVDPTRRNQAWFDDRQADALAARNIDAFHADLDLPKMGAGVTEHPPVPVGETVEAIFTSAHTIDDGITGGEGVSEDGVDGRGESDYQGTNYFTFLGRHQPYALYVPHSYAAGSPLDEAAPAPLAVVLHGGSGNHMSVVPGDGAHADLAEPSRRILVSPLCRGPNCQYADYGELDVLEALADARSRLHVDPVRITLSGYSMGGFGTLRIASRHPDLFNAAVIWAARTGRPTDGNGDPHQTLENFGNVPLFLIHGALDELEPLPTTAVPVARRLDELGYEHALRVHPAAEHLTYGILDRWEQAAAWMDTHTRRTAPRHVRFRYARGWDGHLPELRADGAWWIDDVAQREGADDRPGPFTRHADVDATALTLPDGATGGELGADAGVDGIGPYVETGRDAPGLFDIARILHLRLSNVASVSVDLSPAGLSDGRAFCLRVETDGPVEIRLVGATLSPTSLPGCATGSAEVSASGGATTVSVQGAGQVWIGLAGAG